MPSYHLVLALQQLRISHIVCGNIFVHCACINLCKQCSMHKTFAPFIGRKKKYKIMCSVCFHILTEFSLLFYRIYCFLLNGGMSLVFFFFSFFSINFSVACFRNRGNQRVRCTMHAVQTYICGVFAVWIMLARSFSFVARLQRMRTRTESGDGTTGKCEIIKVQKKYVLSIQLELLVI